MAFSRPFYKSRRLRYLAGGILGTLLLVTGFASVDTGVRDRPKVNLLVEQRECGDSTFVTPMPGQTDFYDEDGDINVRVVTAGCCCCGTETADAGTMGRLRTPGGGGRAEVLGERETRPEVEETDEEARTPREDIGQVPLLQPRPLGYGYPGLVAQPAAIASGGRAFPWWISALAAPLLFADFGDNPPDGTICTDDSGLPIGPNRRRCRI